MMVNLNLILSLSLYFMYELTHLIFYLQESIFPNGMSND